MLKDYVAAKRTILYEGGSFEVRGVTLPDVAAMISQHREAVDRIATIMRVQDQLGLDDLVAVTEMMIDVIKESPYLVADIICSCADEPDAYASAFRLPLTIQVEALRTIGELTFADAVALKKLVADARILMAGMLPPPTEAAA